MNLKDIRDQLDLTQEQLAELMGLEQPRVSDFERGVYKLTKSQRKLCKALIILHEHDLLWRMK